MKRKNIVVLGGGTGTFVALNGLKQYPLNLSAVVSMSDSGGSNKRIRDEFGLLPTSDIRSCLVALSDDNGKAGIIRKLFMYRFEKGEGISGMTFGNLFMAALTDILGSQADAIKQTHKVLRINGQVIPVTFTNTHLYAEYESGHVVNEEHFIDEPEHDGSVRITNLYLKPEATANPDAITAIKNADVVVLGPGDLFTSVLPNVVIRGIAEAICDTKAKKVYTLNLMTKYGQTYGFTAETHIKTLEKYLGGRVLDYVIVNNSSYPADTLKLYEEFHEEPVKDDLGEGEGYKVIRADIVNDQRIEKSKADTLVRSLIRHDSDKLAKTIIDFVLGGV